VNGKEDDAKKERRLAENREGFDKLELRLVVEIEISRLSSATRTVLEKWSWPAAGPTSHSSTHQLPSGRDIETV